MRDPKLAHILVIYTSPFGSCENFFLSAEKQLTIS